MNNPSASVPNEAVKALNPWQGFAGEDWQTTIDVAAFIADNISAYDGNADFLEGPTQRTQKVFAAYEQLREQEAASENGVLSIDTERVSGVDAYPAGYLDKENEVIVGLQTSKPLERTVNPYGGIRMARQACEVNNATFNERLDSVFTTYRRTHNEGVFRAYSPEMLACRRSGVITGLPDAYGRGRIIGDYRRIALYGVDFLIAERQKDKVALSRTVLSDEAIRRLEEYSDQLDALAAMKRMAEAYGCDISKPAANAQEAIQWTYFGYLAAIKENNGAAMSLGRTSSFIDIYIERDLKAGVITEEQAQEYIDDFIMKLRMSRQLRTPDYDTLFAGDPTWVTEVLGGVSNNGKHLVTKTSFRYLQTLYNLGPAPEPNLTVLWSPQLPRGFREFCARVSIETDAIQYENDELMRPRYGDDYAIACCVSAMQVGKQMQFFGARANVAKLLLMSLNAGRDEISGIQVAPATAPMPDGPLDFGEVMNRLTVSMDWLAGVYVGAMNIIHSMHDKYAYEAAQMALHDADVERMMAFGIAGLSVVADSLSAIKYAKVTPVYNDEGIISDFTIEGDYPCYGNDDDRVDAIAAQITELFIAALRRYPAYRGATHTLSVLTITSNVVYGSKTGTTPDGRQYGEAFAPGANPMHERDTCGALAALNSLAKIPYDACRDGISYTMSVTPQSLGPTESERISNLVRLLDGYSLQGGHHVNVNVFDREKLIEAMNHPERYPSLTIRVSGYAVHFHRLTRQQQEEVIARTFHSNM